MHNSKLASKSKHKLSSSLHSPYCTQSSVGYARQLHEDGKLYHDSSTVMISKAV